MFKKVLFFCLVFTEEFFIDFRVSFMKGNYTSFKRIIRAFNLMCYVNPLLNVINTHLSLKSFNSCYARREGGK